MQTQLPTIYYIIFTAVTAAGVVLQALVLLGMFLAIRKSMQKMHETTDELKVHVVPAAAAARRLIEDISPKLKIASTNLVEASHSLRHQANHINATVDDVLNKTTAHVAHVDEMVGAIFTSVNHASTALQHAVAAPYKQFSGIVAGVKAGFGVLRRKEPVAEEAVSTEAAVSETILEEIEKDKTVRNG
jgi:hypothetical protein